MKFKIVVPTYNTEHWIVRCLHSIQSQTYGNFECIVYNDASTDNTGAVIDHFFSERPDPRFRIVHNEKNVKALSNIVSGFKELESEKDPESVLMVIDGDDFLFSEYVLQMVKGAYDSRSPWLTYGNHVHWPTGQVSLNCAPFPEEVIKNRLFRKYKFISSHLRTFKSKLWNSIRDEDLRDEDGRYYSSAWDVAFMLPMLEMAGADRILYIPNILYCYNRFNPLSDDQIRQPDQHRIEKRVRSGEKYDLLDDNRAGFWARSIDLLNPMRFDVMFKYMYAKSLERKYDTLYYRNVYLHHIEMWNGFREFDNESKNSPESFLSHFHAILNSIKESGFNKNVSAVPVSNDVILNGSHRLSACLLYGKDVFCRAGTDGIDGMKDCSAQHFRSNTKTNPQFSDRAALEYAKLSSKCYAVTLFPAATRVGMVEHTKGIIEKFGGICYEKRVELSQKGLTNLMKELYWQESWATENNGAGFAEKSRLCFGNLSSSHTILFLAEFQDLETATECKREIRKVYGIGNHSVHVNDTHEETVRICKALLNKNSIDYLNHAPNNSNKFKRLETLLDEYRLALKSNGADGDEYAISAGAVLARYGLKECKDVDYIHSHARLEGCSSDVQSHNTHGLEFGIYPDSYDEIIHNPRFHFYVNGLKYVTPDIVRKIKTMRGESKDLADIELIDGLELQNEDHNE